MVHTKKMTSHGSISVPVDLRRSLGIQNRDPMDVFEEDGKIILIPHAPRCIFCGADEGVFKVLGKQVCEGCLKQIRQAEDSDMKGGGSNE